MRGLLHELRPAEDEPRPGAARRPHERREGLTAALRHLVLEAALWGPAVELAAEDYEPQDPRIEEAVFRVAQEGLWNALRHAGAERVIVRLRTNGHAVHLQIEDDGCGFDAGVRSVLAVPEGHGLGLSGMRDRVEALGGRFHIRSRPGAGTRLDAVLPSPGDETTGRSASSSGS
jgi:signal transduction histidine kinase